MVVEATVNGFVPVATVALKEGEFNVAAKVLLPSMV
jgi:hypothetical protein